METAWQQFQKEEQPAMEKEKQQAEPMNVDAEEEKETNLFYQVSRMLADMSLEDRHCCRRTASGESRSSPGEGIEQCLPGMYVICWQSSVEYPG